jgi:hypothetical protein
MRFSHRQSRSYAFLIFSSGLLLLSLIGQLWPWTLALIGITLALMGFAQGKIYEPLLNFVIFGALTANYFFQFSWSIAIPIILVISSIVEVYRAYQDEVDLPLDEEIIDKEKELEEDQ